MALFKWVEGGEAFFKLEVEKQAKLDCFSKVGTYLFKFQVPCTVDISYILWKIVLNRAERQTDETSMKFIFNFKM